MEQGGARFAPFFAPLDINALVFDPPYADLRLAHNVDGHLVVAILVGSVPGGILGSYLATRVPVLWLRRILCAVLLMTGARMLWA